MSASEGEGGTTVVWLLEILKFRIATWRCLALPPCKRRFLFSVFCGAFYVLCFGFGKIAGGEGGEHLAKYLVQFRKNALKGNLRKHFWYYRRVKLKS